ncbi:MAG: DMT family transporter [Calothrix sp. FI2-JRJ7]|jgi:drug/metabolite transporter (DMT)-like permease|nr:DMT family transporter [Calothrix sp. FI2-JRJ7]
MVINYQGEIAALVAAVLWAFASVVYGRVGAHIPPLHLNLIKGIIAIVLLLITIVATGKLSLVIAPVPLCLLLLSGVIGIGLGDTAFLAGINSLGARRLLLLETLAPPMTAVFALIFLQERLNASAWCGVLLTILGVAWVISERTEKEINSSLPLRGVVFGLLAAVANASGAVLSRAALVNTNINPLWAASIRLGAATFFLLPLIVWQQDKSKTSILSYSKQWRVVAATCFAAFCGTYLGIWLQQTAIKLAPVGIASTLLQTSPIFILPLALWTGEKVSIRAVIGVIIAIAGIALLFYLK